MYSHFFQKMCTLPFLCTHCYHLPSDFVVRCTILSVQAEFEFVDGDDAMYWCAVQCREDMSTGYETMRRSALQRMFEIVNYKKCREGNLIVGSKKVVQEITV